ncbi:hypothetical protein [Paenibacillus sp. DMB20]|uniref:hypothetical protein n=1 Tax=Paenibacillus sp. DMB20 TaxID=1642570 RepID=UPI000627AF1C|nr:hypothetical protein [Paenibacillus sp. DMB20]KKO54494.1 hypothetical protein XI25_06805 [Paenibacillus sp. DMB20]
MRTNVEDELTKFYEPFFPDNKETRNFIEKCYEMSNPLPRRIINNVHRLISIGEAAAIGRGGHGIQMAHFVICIEAIFHLLNPDEDIEKVNRLGRIKFFFEEFTKSTR